MTDSARYIARGSEVPEPEPCTATISLHSITSSAGANSDGGTGRPSRLPAANDEPWSAASVAAIVVAGASVVVVAPAGEVAGVVVIAQDIARSSDPPAASIILVADQTDLVDVGDFGG